MLPFLTILAGIWVGMQFSVLAIIPASVVVIFAFCLTTPQAALAQIAIHVSLLLCCVQLGYMTGLAAREPYARFRVRINFRRPKQV